MDGDLDAMVHLSSLEGAALSPVFTGGWGGNPNAINAINAGFDLSADDEGASSLRSHLPPQVAYQLLH